ncbi:UDP-glucosyltransferase 2-like [Teleopsis dalmanni]|nr:UDP-glucosyltransferase 2-like [Teleopsis dalmanni]
MLLNQHFSLSFPRPYVPNMIQVGGLHISHKPSPLPIDIADFINGAENGVIYFSMGSNIKSEKLPKETIDIFLKTFASLPQRVLWKFEAEKLPGKPDNVFISKWFPQPDILAHPKVKLFITHGGLLSTMEAIYYAKPIIGIPNFFDQFLNVANAVKSGYALDVDINTISIASFGAKIKKILSNKIYTEKIKKISRQYHDQPIKPIDAAIYWTEYVLRHEGANHMRVAGQDLNFMEVHSLDVIGVLIFVSAVGLWVIYWFMSKILGFIFTSNAIKHKKE